MSVFGVFERSLVWRSVILWVLVRLFALPVLAYSGESPVFIAPTAALIVVVATSFLCWITTQRLFEHVMLANLGTGPWAIGLLMVIPPAVLELAVSQLERI